VSLRRSRSSGDGGIGPALEPLIRDTAVARASIQPSAPVACKGHAQIAVALPESHNFSAETIHLLVKNVWSPIRVRPANRCDGTRGNGSLALPGPGICSQATLILLWIMATRNALASMKSLPRASYGRTVCPLGLMELPHGRQHDSASVHPGPGLSLQRTGLADAEFTPTV